MTKQRTEDWIRILQPDGKTMIASPRYISKLLGLENTEKRANNLGYRLLSLERKVHRLESPNRQQKVLGLLFEEEKPRSYKWLEYRVMNLDLQDVSDLVKQGKLTTSKAGRNTMYALSSITHAERTEEKQ